MKKRHIVAALLLMAASVQSLMAQKLVIYKSNSTPLEFNVSELDSIEFVSGEPTPMPSYLSCPDDHHPHAIDLGLPSGTKWCCCNVGASTPEGYGGYYAWGETSEKSVYDWDTYKYYKDTGNEWGLTKYCTRSSYGYNGFTDGKTELDLSDDVARVRMGAPWRMPSVGQMEELINNCSRHQWTRQNGVNGILVTGPSGGQVFLPAAGGRWDVGLNYAGSDGDYWSSSVGPHNDHVAYSLNFFSDYWHWSDGGYNRGGGHSVRAVCP